MAHSAFWILLRETYAPGLHIAFAAGWFLALDGALAIAAGRQWSPGAGAAAGIGILFIVLFYLRAADEWKDVDYDREFNPGRPLARGAVSVQQVAGIMAASAVVALALHLAVFGAGLAAGILAMDIVYGFALVFAERASETLRQNIWLNLVVTYPVNVLLSIYVLFLHSQRNGVPITPASLSVVVAFALAFLFYEFARKTSWPQHATPGKRLYSTSLGTTVSAALACGFAAGAVALTAWAGLWLPAAGLLTVGFGLRRLLRVRNEPTAKPAAPLTGPAMQFLVVYYVGVVAAAAARTWLW